MNFIPSAWQACANWPALEAAHLASMDEAPAEQLELIDTEARDLMAKQQSILANLRIELAKKDIHILTADPSSQRLCLPAESFLSRCVSSSLTISD